MLCICSLFLKYRKLSRIFLENFKNLILTIFVPVTVIENICFYPILINFILFHQMAYQLIWVANTGALTVVLSLWQRDHNHMDSYRMSTMDVPESPSASDARVFVRSGVTTYTFMKNDGIQYHQLSSFSPESMRLRSLRQSERTTMRDPVQHKRWTYPCYRAVNTKHKQDGCAVGVRYTIQIFCKSDK